MTEAGPTTTPNPPEPGAAAPSTSDARREARARFKVFFGFAPGVGKTYRMLQVARDLVAEGVDVVVGAVETHGRYDTAGLLLGLELLPRRELREGGRVVEELDLDRALARRPRVLLLDDLAHANAPGARHARRWQDVEELLEAGVSVYTTLNVEHVESLGDVVEGITELPVGETVPDSILDRADEVEIVDVAPEELLQRLQDGKVHLPEAVEPARARLFKRGNLLALRELALRRMAERVDADVLAYRAEHGVEAPWATAERVLVCVGPAPDSARLVRAARRVAAGLRAPWVAAAVAASARPLGREDRERLDANLALAESLGAEVVRLNGVRVADAVLDLARRRNVTRIVLGKPRHPRWRDRVRGSLVDEIIRGSGDIEVTVLSGADGEAERSAPSVRSPPPLVEYLRAAAIVGLASLLAVLARNVWQVPDVEMLFLLGVLVVALTTGRRASALAAALSVLSYDFLFVPPHYTLDVLDPRYFLTFAMMFGVSMVIGTLALRLREEREASVARERHTAALYALSRELAVALDEPAVAAVCVKVAADAFGAAAALLRVRGPGVLVPLAALPAEERLSASEHAAAAWVATHGRPAGRGTDTLPGEAVICAPVRAWGDVAAVLVIRPRGDGRLAGEQRTFLEALGRHTALALDRVRLAEEARASALRARTEELRSGLLSAVSHDLRTPLATITGAATTLRGEPEPDPETRRDLSTAICEEAERLERLVSNLLDMTRLDSGAVQPRREWIPLVEVVGGALTRVEGRLGGRRVVTRLPDELTLVSIDPVLVEQLLINLVENAAKYTPDGTDIEVRATREERALRVEVADRGPGIPPGQEERIFERFQRGAHAGVRGVGLGLPIARAIAQAHGGTLVAENRPGGGALFRLTLPLLEEPPTDAPEAPGSAPA